MTVATLVPDDVKVVVGTVLVGGWADGTRIGITQVNDKNLFHYGTDLVSRSLVNDKAYQITLTLQQTSISNQLLDSLFKLDELTKGITPIPLTVQDLNGTSKIASPSCVLVKDPDQDTAKEIQTREWVIIATDCIVNIGGSLTALV